MRLMNRGIDSQDPSSMVHERGQQQCCLQPANRLQATPSWGGRTAMQSSHPPPSLVPSQFLFFAIRNGKVWHARLPSTHSRTATGPPGCSVLHDHGYSIFTRLSYGLNVLSSPDYSLVGWSGVKILIEVDIDGVNWSEYQSWWGALTLSSLASLCSAVSAACLSCLAPLFLCNLTCLSSTFIPFHQLFRQHGRHFLVLSYAQVSLLWSTNPSLTQITKLVSYSRGIDNVECT